jgi:hypothetical protein
MRLEENDRSAWNIDASFKANGTRTLVPGVEVFFAACSRGAENRTQLNDP